MTRPHRSRVDPAVKRVADTLLSGLGLLLLSPLLVAIAVAIRLTMGRPVLFRQVRPGLHGRPFELVKFRTMTEAGADGTLLPDDRRVTRLGHLLRRLSFDELPELWNILRGDMSLVGPRPLLMEYLPRYTAEQARRHDVRPGLTGWAQVSGRRGLPMPERFALDVWYVDHWSLGLDLRILVRTARMVLTGDGVEPGSTPAPVLVDGHFPAATVHLAGPPPASDHRGDQGASPAAEEVAR